MNNDVKFDRKQGQLYLTTGEFAKLCHVNKHTLFHYCETGLFTPAYTDENGYRYYHVLQYDTFLTITQLRTLGMSLAEIKKYLEERSPEQMTALYEEQESLIDRKIEQLKQMKKRTHAQKQEIEQALNHSGNPFSETQKKNYLLCSPPAETTDDYTMTVHIGDLIHAAAGKLLTNSLGMICNTDETACSTKYSCRFYVYVSSKQQDCIIKPAGTYLTAYHNGPYETLQSTYQKLMSYARIHHLEHGKWIYAETVIGDWAVRKPQDYIIKVSVQTG